MKDLKGFESSFKCWLSHHAQVVSVLQLLEQCCLSSLKWALEARELLDHGGLFGLIEAAKKREKMVPVEFHAISVCLLQEAELGDFKLSWLARCSDNVSHQFQVWNNSSRISRAF